MGSNKFNAQLQGIIYSFFAIAFAFFLYIISMKLDLSKNPILNFLSQHIFSIYIIQVIPLMIFTKIGLVVHPYIFAIVCMSSSICLAMLLDMIVPKLWNLIYRKEHI